MALMRDCDCGGEPALAPAMFGWVLVGFGIGLFTCWCCLLGRQVWRSFPPRVLGLIASVRAAVRPDQVRPFSNSEPVFSTEVEDARQRGLAEEEMRVFKRRRWENVQVAIYHFSLRAVPLLCILIVASAFLTQPHPIGSFYYSTLYTTPMVELLCASAFFMGALALREKLSMRVAECFLVVLFQALGVHGFLAADPYTFVAYYHRLAIPSQMAISQLLASPRLLFLPNLINFLLQLTVMALSPPLRSRFGHNFVSFFLPFVLNYAVSAGASAGLMAESKALVVGLEASQGEATAMSLLGAMCDCVVRLRSDLSLRGSFPKLNAMLLREPLGKQQEEEEPFIKFVCPEDVERFSEFLEKQSQNPTKTAALHLHLVDSMRNKVPVRIFHTCTVGVDGSLSHMLGLCDDSAEQRDVFPVPMGQGKAETQRAASGSQDGSSSDWADFARVLPSASLRVTSEKSLDSKEGHGPDTARVTVRACLSCQVLEECEMSQLQFGFSGDSQLAFLGRFGKDGQRVEGCLQTLLAMSSAQRAVKKWTKLGEVTISNPATQKELNGFLKMRPVQSGRADAEGQSLFQLGYTDFDFVFTSKQRDTRPKSKNRNTQAELLRQRAEQAKIDCPGSVDCGPP